MIVGDSEYAESLRLQPLHHPGERNRLANMMDSAQPADHPFDTHPKARMWNRSIAAQVQIPFERFERQLMALDLGLERFVVVFALASTDNLAVTFRGEHIDA